MPDTPERYYTVTEVASILRVSRQTVYNWIDKGELTGRKFGGSVVRISSNDFEEFQKRAEIIGYPPDDNPKQAGRLPVPA